MNRSLKRITIYVSDIKIITGKSERTCQRIYHQIRDTFGVQKNQLVTLYHASDFFGVPVEQLTACLY